MLSFVSTLGILASIAVYLRPINVNHISFNSQVNRLTTLLSQQNISLPLDEWALKDADEESTKSIVYTGVDWKDFIQDIESQGIYRVSSSCKNRPCKYIKLIEVDTDLCFKGLVQKLPNGGFKLHDGDISASPSSCESVKK